MELNPPTHDDDVQDWSALQRGQQVAFQHSELGPVTGTLDERTADASVMWVVLNDGAGRLLIHREDGYRLQPVSAAG